MPSKTRTNDLAEPILERLPKVLASAGIGSRRHCEEYILSGRVTVDGEQVNSLGLRVDQRRQKILLDGEAIQSEPKRYYLLNKPKGYLCTNHDPSGRPRVLDLFSREQTRLFTVGRLDENSQGLLLVTNDGQLANRLAHPRYQIPRTYRIQVVGIPTKDTLNQLRRGMYFGDGNFHVQSVRLICTKGKGAFLNIVLTKGRNREVRRLLARASHKVIHLERIAFGPLKLGRLPIGRYRALKPAELKQLRTFDVDRQGFRSGDSTRRAKPRAKPRGKVKKQRSQPSRQRKHANMKSTDQTARITGKKSR